MSEPTASPPPDDDIQSQLTDLSSDLSDIGVSRDLQALLNRGLTSKSLPRNLRSQRASAAFAQAFELIGGVPRLALWADRNPDKFFQLYARMLLLPSQLGTPQQQAGITQDEMAWVSARRLMYQMSSITASDIRPNGDQEDN